MVAGERIIRSGACIEEGVAWLRRVEPRFAEAVERTGLPPLRRRKAGFEALLGAIVSQQLSVAAADTIWNRLDAAGLTRRRALLAAPDDTLRACGLSRQKIRYARALAAAPIRYPALAEMPSDRVIAELVAVPGIGRWTAEIYAMFALGRANVLAAGDLALQEAARLLFALDARPTEKALRALAEPWAPWRAVAARILWAYYRYARNREGVR